MPSTLITLTEIFDHIVLRMPDYQRGYSWESNKQLKDLWNDLENINVDSYHFTGVITLEKITEFSKYRWEKEFDVSDDLKILIDNEEYVPYFVVDGQQRLVSLVILLSLLKDEIEGVEKISQKFISIENNSKTFYLFGYEKDTP